MTSTSAMSDQPPGVAATTEPVGGDGLLGYSTLQFAWGGVFDATPTEAAIHLVRRTARGTPGPTLCGIDRFAKDGPGWSVGGGITGTGCPTPVPCSACVEASDPTLPIGSGTFRKVFLR